MKIITKICQKIKKEKNTETDQTKGQEEKKTVKNKDKRRSLFCESEI